MRKIIILSVAGLLLGCHAPKKTAINKEIDTGYVVYKTHPGEIYVPEVHQFVDWSENFESWHYHGRSRMPTPEEREIHVLEKRLEDADPWDQDPIVQMLNAKKVQYADKLASLHLDDMVRFQKFLKEILDENNRVAGTETSEK